MLFNDIIGHTPLVGMLKNAISTDRVAHAYLFYGPKGIGKKTMAKAFAQALLCNGLKGDSACGVCLSCKKAVTGNHPDIHYLEPSGNSIKIEQIRNLQKEVNLRSYEGKRKIFIICKAEVLTGQAANSLLKMLEEPPEDTVFIMVTANLHSLLPTILSRCQQVSFNKVHGQLIRDMLIERFQKKPGEAEFLAALADGNMGQAISLAEEENILRHRDYAIKLAELARTGNYLDFYQLSEELETVKEDIITIIDFMSAWYRDILVWQETGNEALLFNKDKIEHIKEFDKYPTKKIVQLIETIDSIKEKIAANANLKLAIEVLLLTINYI